MALVGVQPVLMQVPPNNLRSMMATLRPACVRRPASEGPAWPAPMMMASKCVGILGVRDDQVRANNGDNIFE